MKARLDELIYSELHPTIRALSDGGFDKELADLVRKPGNGVRAAEAVRREFFGTAKTWQQLLDDCHQDSVHSDFTESRWPLELAMTDEADWEVAEFHSTNKMTGTKQLLELKKLAAKGEMRLLKGSRLAMEYIARHPGQQMHYPIVLPLCVGATRMPVFTRDWNDEKKRCLDLYAAGFGFFPDVAWLVLLRKQK